MITTTSTVTSANPAAGSNVAVTFPYRFDEDEHLDVYRVTTAGVRTSLTEGTDYSVAGTGNSSGGTLTITTVTAGDTIVVAREVDITQQQDYVSNDKFPSAGTENQLDKQIMIDQQLQGGLNRAIKVLHGEPNPVVSARGDRQLTVPFWDASGDYTEDTLAQFWSRLPAPPGTVSNVGTTTWADDAARAAEVPSSVGQIGVQLDTNHIYVSSGITAGDWIRQPAAAQTTIHVVQDATRTNLEGAGSAEYPYNCLSEDSLATLIENDTLVPANSKVLIGPGTYTLTLDSTRIGLDIRKNIWIQGSGQQSTTLKFPDDSVASSELSCHMIGVDWFSPFSGTSRVRITDLTLDPNFGNAHSSNDALKTSFGGIRNYAVEFHLENIDLINCGETASHAAESFYITTDGWEPTDPNRVCRYINVHFYNEIAGGNTGGTALHIGSGSYDVPVDAVIRDCVVERTMDGVGIGLSTTGTATIDSCRVLSTDPATVETTCILHDTGTLKSLTITNCHLAPANNLPALRCVANTNSLVFKGNTVTRAETDKVTTVIETWHSIRGVVADNIINGTGPAGASLLGCAYRGISVDRDLLALTNAAFTADAGTDVITSAAHGLVDGDTVYLTGADLPDGLLTGVIYFVITATTNTFQLAVSSGGSAIDFTDNGTGSRSWTQAGVYDPETPANPDQFTGAVGGYSGSNNFAYNSTSGAAWKWNKTSSEWELTPLNVAVPPFSSGAGVIARLIAHDNIASLASGIRQVHGRATNVTAHDNIFADDGSTIPTPSIPTILNAYSSTGRELRAYWGLSDETEETGTGVVLTANGTPEHATPASIAASDTAGIDGTLGSAVWCDDLVNYYSSPDSEHDHDGTYSWWYSFWVWPTNIATANSRDYVSKADSAANRLFRTYNVTDSKLSVTVARADTTWGTTLQSTGNLTASAWNHVVFGYDKGRREIFCYLNGAAKDSVGQLDHRDGATVVAAVEFQVGKYYSSGTASTAGIDELSMHTYYVPDTAKVAWLYNSGAGRLWAAYDRETP